MALMTTTLVDSIVEILPVPPTHVGTFSDFIIERPLELPNSGDTEQKRSNYLLDSRTIDAHCSYCSPFEPIQRPYERADTRVERFNTEDAARTAPLRVGSQVHFGRSQVHFGRSIVGPRTRQQRRVESSMPISPPRAPRSPGSTSSARRDPRSRRRRTSNQRWRLPFLKTERTPFLGIFAPLVTLNISTSMAF